jgi:hypothetical protein
MKELDYKLETWRRHLNTLPLGLLAVTAKSNRKHARSLAASVYRTKPFSVNVL